MKLDASHRAALNDILQWRRDVRHFRPDPIAPEVMDALRVAVDFAPSVGNARPWRVCEVATPALREAVIENFAKANAEAAKMYDDEARARYDALKLAGLREAPVHLAFFTELAPAEGRGLGRQTMPEMLQYSTVTAIHTLWLAARAHNIGVGWVSILDPDAVCSVLGVPDGWSLTGYLCLGHAAQADDTPLLHRAEWQENTHAPWLVL